MEDTSEGPLRRSKRGQVPLKYTFPVFVQKVLLKGKEGKESQKKDDDVFKKSLPPPLRKKTGRKAKLIEKTVEDTTSKGPLRRSKRGQVPLKYTFPGFVQKVLLKGKEGKESQKLIEKTVEDTTSEGPLRRSKRGQVPLKYTFPVFVQKVLLKGEEGKERVKKKDNINKNNILGDSSSNSISTVESIISNHHQNASNFVRSEISNTSDTNTNVEAVPVIECSQMIMDHPPPVEHLNIVFDQLRNSRMNKSKKEHAITARKCDEAPTTCRSTQPNISTVSSTTYDRSNFELMSWLKNITESEVSATQRNETNAIFDEMRISSCMNLNFTELQGIEYAFYETEEQASLGYLRFKPRQVKPRNRDKRYHLHFVALVGNFRITANELESLVRPGDMVVIKKSVYYEIENLCEDISILMVIKQ